jgi:hypothetical protein
MKENELNGPSHWEQRQKQMLWWKLLFDKPDGMNLMDGYSRKTSGFLAKLRPIVQAELDLMKEQYGLKGNLRVNYLHPKVAEHLLGEHQGKWQVEVQIEFADAQDCVFMTLVKES